MHRLAPIEAVPTLADRHAKAIAAKRVAFDAPWSEAILRMLETTPFAELPRHDARVIGEGCGIPPEEAERCLELLAQSGVVRRVRSKYKVTGAQLVDTQGGRTALHRLKAHWAEVAARRLREPHAETDLVAYNVISVAEADLDRIHDILRAAFREIRTLVAASEPAELVAWVNLHVIKLFPHAAVAERVNP